jgi:hypothetical protein
MFEGKTFDADNELDAIETRLKQFQEGLGGRMLTGSQFQRAIEIGLRIFEVAAMHRPIGGGEDRPATTSTGMGTQLGGGRPPVTVNTRCPACKGDITIAIT